MSAKTTAPNQLAWPLEVTAAVGAAQPVGLHESKACMMFTPARTKDGEAVRAKLASMNLSEANLAAAVAWARRR